MKSNLLLLSACAVIVLSATGVAQESSGKSKQLISWEDSHPGEWVLRRSKLTNAPSFLFGSIVGGRGRPNNDIEIVNQALLHCQDSANVMELNPENLRLISVKRIDEVPLAFSAKLAVRFQQHHGNVPVEGAFVNVVMGPDGGMLAIQSHYVNLSIDTPSKPEETSTAALRAAIKKTVALYGEIAFLMDEPTLTVLPGLWTESGKAELCWRINANSPPLSRGRAIGHCWYISADAPRLDSSYDFSTIRKCHLVPLPPDAPSTDGQIKAYVATGTKPADMNNLTLSTFGHIAINEIGGSGQAYSDVDGNFSATSTGNASYRFYPREYHSTGQSSQITTFVSPPAQYLETETLIGFGLNVILNDGPDQNEDNTALFSAFQVVTKFREFTQNIVDLKDMPVEIHYSDGSLNPGEAEAAGSKIKFAASGSGFVNMAYSTVVAHEMGHRANLELSQGTLAATDGLDEGFADAWAMYLFETDLIAEDYAGVGTYVRSGLNNAQWCGESSSYGCEMDAHIGGLPLMGALWDVRSGIIAAGGTALQAEDLFKNTLDLYNWDFLDETIRDAWLVTAGGSFFNEIDYAFTSHGWPQFGTNLVDIDHYPPLPDTGSATSPYLVTAAIVPSTFLSQFNGSLTATELQYRDIHGGGSPGWTITPLIQDPIDPEKYTGQIPPPIPGQPGNYEYRLRVEYGYMVNQTGEIFLPESGAFNFLVGVLSPIYSNNFESPPGENQGWTHGNLPGSSGDDWQRQIPGFNSGSWLGTVWTDPSASQSNGQIWGTDIRDDWDGKYQSSANTYLLSPVIDASLYSGIQLRFQRWLTVPSNDIASIEIRDASGAGPWAPISTIDYGILGSSWLTINKDLPNAAGKEFQLRFRLQTDTSINYGGWNIDDLEVFAISPPATTNANSLYLSGDTELTRSEAFSLVLTGPALNTGYELRATLIKPLISSPFDIGANYLVAATGVTDALGAASIPLVIPPLYHGDTIYFEAVTTLRDSNVLRVKVWN